VNVPGWLTATTLAYRKRFGDFQPDYGVAVAILF
jgi:hypothetical protein